MDKFRIKKTTKHKDTNYCSDSSSQYVCESNSFAEKKIRIYDVVMKNIHALGLYVLIENDQLRSECVI